VRREFKDKELDCARIPKYGSTSEDALILDCITADVFSVTELRIEIVLAKIESAFTPIRDEIRPPCKRPVLTNIEVISLSVVIFVPFKYKYGSEYTN
jgi:hypothetical protein